MKIVPPLPLSTTESLLERGNESSLFSFEDIQDTAYSKGYGVFHILLENVKKKNRNCLTHMCIDEKRETFISEIIDIIHKLETKCIFEIQCVR